MMRAFLAIEPASGLLEALEREIAPIRAAFPDLSWVHPERRHLTLKFMGDIAPDQLTEIARGLDHVCARHRPITMDAGGLGAFPNFRRARVLWLGVAQESRLELLHHDIELSCAAAGVEVEGRPFRPHITLARIRPGLDEASLRRLAAATKRVGFRATDAVESITLFESTLTRAGARYRRVHVATLQGGR